MARATVLALKSSASSTPPLGSLVDEHAQIGIDKLDRFLVIDLTSLVQKWLGDDGQGTNGILNNGLAVALTTGLL